MLSLRIASQPGSQTTGRRARDGKAMEHGSSCPTAPLGGCLRSATSWRSGEDPLLWCWPTSACPDGKVLRDLTQRTRGQATRGTSQGRRRRTTASLSPLASLTASCFRAPALPPSQLRSEAALPRHAPATGPEPRDGAELLRRDRAQGNSRRALGKLVGLFHRVHFEFTGLVSAKNGCTQRRTGRFCSVQSGLEGRDGLARLRCPALDAELPRTRVTAPARERGEGTLPSQPSHGRGDLRHAGTYATHGRGRCGRGGWGGAAGGPDPTKAQTRGNSNAATSLRPRPQHCCRGTVPAPTAGQHDGLETTAPEQGRRSEERGSGAGCGKLWPSPDPLRGTQTCSSFCGEGSPGRRTSGSFARASAAIASPGFNRRSEATLPKLSSVLIWKAGWHHPPTSHEGCEAKLINVCKTL